MVHINLRGHKISSGEQLDEELRKSFKLDQWLDFLVGFGGKIAKWRYNWIPDSLFSDERKSKSLKQTLSEVSNTLHTVDLFFKRT